MDTTGPDKPNDDPGIDWALAKEIFSDALECAPAERDAFVRNTCEGDPQIRGAVERLIQSIETADDFMPKDIRPDQE